MPWMDYARYITGFHCGKCHEEVTGKSYLQYELERRYPNTTELPSAGYLSDDMRGQPLTEPGKLSFYAGAMSSGKSQMIIRRAKAEVDAGNKLITLVLTPRRTLTIGLFLGENCDPDDWGVFCSGNYGAQSRLRGKNTWKVWRLFNNCVVAAGHPQVARRRTPSTRYR